MNFGVRLPGPFRVGVDSRGRANVGITLGPFSASTGIGQHRPTPGQPPFYPVTLEGALAELVTLGWIPTFCDQRTAFLRKGWRAVRVDAVQGGVTWSPMASRRMLALKSALWIAAFLLVLAVCASIGS